MSKPALPPAFCDLERWSAWSLATEPERSDRRQSSSMESIQAFYDDLLRRAAEIFAYVEQFPFDEMPEDARNLFYLTLSLAEVAPAVELFRQPTVIDGYDVKRFSMKRREVRAQRT